MKLPTSNTQRPRWIISVANWWAVKLIAVFSFGFLAMGVVPLLFTLVALAFDAQADPLKDVGFALPSALAAMGALGLAFVYRQHLAREQRLSLVDGDTPRPWLYREDWAAGVVEPNDGQRIGHNAITAAITGGIAGTVVAMQVKNVRWEPLPLVVAAVVGGLSLYCLYQILRCVTVRRRFGKSLLRLANVPGKIGGKLAGVVMVPAVVANSSDIQVSLACVEQWSRGDDHGQETVWRQTATVTRPLAADKAEKVGLTVVFDIPASALETDLDGDVTWKLNVFAKLPGFDYHDEFVVPIFKTTTEQQTIQLDEGVLSRKAEPSLDDRLARQGISVERSGEQVSYYASPPRSLLLAFLFILLPVLFLGLAVWVANPFGVDLFTSGVSIILLLGALQFVFVSPASWFAWSRLTITEDAWICQSSWFGLGPVEYRFQSREIDAFELHHNQRHFFTTAIPGADVLVRLRSGESVVAVRGVQGGSTQLELADELERLARPDSRSNPKNAPTITPSPTF